jgi:DNA (cytosine-5)-methyltransferase 1
MILFGSVCSGIEAASVAWAQLGWKAAWLSEIEPFPCAVLAHHYPDVPNLGDMTLLPDRIRSGAVMAPDVFCGGTPCQAFSVAGLRKSLDDARGNLSLTFCEIANAIDSKRVVPSIIFWENVPGVLNTKDNAFGCFLGALAGEDDALTPPGGRWSDAGFIDGPQRAIAWRVLDAQHFGVAQRRKRVYVVASARADFDPASVLFEFEGLRRDTAPSREAGQTTPTLTKECTGVSRTGHNENGWYVPTVKSFASGGNPDLMATLCAKDNEKWGCNQWVNEGKAIIQPVYGGSDPECADTVTSKWAKGSGGPSGSECGLFVAQPIPLDLRNAGRDPEKHDEINRQGVGVGEAGDPSHTITSACVHGVAQPIALAENTIGRQPLNGGNGNGFTVGGPMYTLNATGVHGVEANMAVRRLTPTECERLQGFPDGYTNTPWRKQPEAPDGPRYKALGNSWAVPVITWIGKRIDNAIA